MNSDIDTTARLTPSAVDIHSDTERRPRAGALAFG
jgi:hypothetical protein